jgi:hypothetical protein
MRLTMRLTVKSWLKFVIWVHGNDPNSNGVPFNSPGLGAVGFSGRGNPTAPYPGSTRRDIIRSNPERVSQCAWDDTCTRRVKVPFWWSFPPATESNCVRATWGGEQLEVKG